MISIGDVVSLLNTFWTTYKGLKANQEECRRFHEHTQLMLERMEEECGGDVPKVLQRRLAKFMGTLTDLTLTVEALKASSILKQIFMSSDISALITRAYGDIDSAAEELQLDLQLDVYKAQRDHEEARRADSERAARILEEVLTNEGTILKELTEHRIEMREALTFMHKTVAQTTGSQRKALEQGIRTLQKCSSDISTGLQVPDEFVITSLEVVIHRHMRLGIGGFAEVYEADWNRTRVAVKVFPRGVMPSVLDREFKVWSRLRHPNILELFGACSFANPPFFVCALKPNGDIMSYLEKHPDVNRTELLHQASLGLSYLHQRHIVHGDLKGANILVDEHGRACLADFGLSEIKHTTTFDSVQPAQSAPTFGTARWTSPEVLMGEPVTLASDIYSFAMTMYEVYTDSMPFANTPDTLLLSVVHDRRMRPPRPAPDIARELSDQVWALVTESWTHNPPDRPPAGQIAERLELYAKTAMTPSNRGEHPKSGGSPSSIFGESVSSTEEPEDVPRSQDPAPNRDISRRFGRTPSSTSLIVNIPDDVVRRSNRSRITEDQSRTAHEQFRRLAPGEASASPFLTGNHGEQIRDWRSSVPAHADPNVVPAPSHGPTRRHPSATRRHPDRTSDPQPHPSLFTRHTPHAELEVPPSVDDALSRAGWVSSPQGPWTTDFQTPVTKYADPQAPFIIHGNTWATNAPYPPASVFVGGTREIQPQDSEPHPFLRDAEGNIIIGVPRRKGIFERLVDHIYSSRACAEPPII